MPVGIRQATPDRVDDLAALLGRTFVDDPMIVWPFGADRAELVTAFFKAFNEGIAARGWLWEAGDAEGVAAWIPPGSDTAMMDIDRSVRPILAESRARHGEMWDWISNHFPPERSWYLDHIAVEPERRGNGIGTALIEHGLAFARRDGTPAFLETARPGNVAYYERRGFVSYLDEDAPGGGPHIWFMRYDPSPRAATRQAPTDKDRGRRR
jgi:ribosomal protein S18 acetylase RimI-like enzyme